MSTSELSRKSTATIERLGKLVQSEKEKMRAVDKVFFNFKPARGARVIPNLSGLSVDLPKVSSLAAFGNSKPSVSKRS